MANLMPLPKIRFKDSNGRPLVGGKVFFYVSGTTTPKSTFKDRSQATANTNPVILDANGDADIWLEVGYYKVVLKTSNDVTIWTVDGVAADANGLNLDDLNAAVTAAQAAAETAGLDAWAVVEEAAAEQVARAEAAADIAVGAVSGSVNTFWANTYAAAVALAATLGNGATVIAPDANGIQTRYTVASGALTSPVADTAAGVQFTPSGVGAVAVSAEEKIREIVGIKGFGEVADGVADDQAALVKALSQRGTLSPDDRGGILYVDGGGRTFAIASDLQIPTNTRLTNCKIVCKAGAKITLGGASVGDTHYYSGIPGVTVVGEVSAGVPVSTNLVVTDYLTRGDMRGVLAINAKGAGIKTSINTRNMTWGPTYAYNCCQDVAAITGAIEMRGSDHTVTNYVIGQASVTGAEITAEAATPGSTQIQYRVGVLCNMSTSSNGGVIRGEVSGFAGVYVQNSFSTEFGSLLADQNAGHGVYFATNCGDFQADVRGSDNNRLNGAYDTLTMADATVVRYNIRSISTDELGAIGNPMRFHFRAAASPSVVDRGRITHPTGRLNGATRLSLPAVSPSIVEGRHPHLSFTNADTTPSVDGGTCFKFANAGATSVTTFDDGYDGKRISVLGDGNTTLVHPGIVCPLGRSYLIRSNDVVDLERRAGVWYVVSQPRRASASVNVNPPSIAVGGSYAAPVTVTGAALGDIAQATLDIDLQGLSLTAHVSAADTVTVVISNSTAAPVDLGSTNIRAFVTKI